MLGRISRSYHGDHCILEFVYFVPGALVKGKEDGEKDGKQIFAPKKKKVKINFKLQN